MTYPVELEADAVLTDGGIVHVRPIRPDDADLLREFHSRLSPETVYNRFFTMVHALPARDVERFTNVDYDDRMAVVAILHGQIVGVCRYDRSPGTHQAEVAIVVEDGHQGRGLGPLLLEHITAAARERGIERFFADVLPSNRRMLTVFRTAGFEVERELADGYVELSYPIRVTEASLEVMRSREHKAEARSVARLVSPKAVAVVGASRRPGTVGHEVFRSLLAHGFEGPVYPVNPNAPHVASVRAWADVRDVPDDVDLAVIALPAEQVADAVQACSEKKVRGLVVVSSGFADAGEEGRKRLTDLVRQVRDGGMRLIGPNAMGIVNTDPSVRLHATFAAGSPPPGRVGILSQSGGLASTVLAEATRRALGLSTFVSLGDRADVSGNDLLQYWEDDERTDVVVLHVQGFGNPRKFARIARRVGRAKPVVALTSGRGHRDAAVEALFASAGVIRVATLTQMFETAQLLTLQPLPSGRRVGVVSTSSALAGLATDACEAHGLRVPRLPAALVEQLSAVAGTAHTANPVDVGPLAAAEELTRALRLVAESGEVDALIALVTPNPDEAGMAAGLLDVSQSTDIPVLSSFLGNQGVPAELACNDAGEAPQRGSVPSWPSPEGAAIALARAADHAAWRSRDPGEQPDLPGLDVEAAEAAIAGHPLDGKWLPFQVTADLLGAFGLTVWPTRRVSTLDEAVAAAHELGWPVGLKSADARWRNRLDVGAVRLGLIDEAALVEAWRSIEPFVVPGEAFVQPMAPGGVSTVVRLIEDQAVGPLVSLRLGGVAADLLADPVTRTAPLTDVEAEEIVQSVRGGALLRGMDTGALEDVVLRLGRLSEDVPAVAEVLLDPLLVHERGVTALHAGARLLAPRADPELGPRRLVDLRG